MRTKKEIRNYYNEAYTNGAYGGAIPLADRHGGGTELPQQMEKFRSFTKEDRILEIGCGEGLQMEGMCGFVKQVYGVDISDVAIANAGEFLKEKANCFLYVNDNIESFPDDYFDFIWERTVFQHMLKEHVIEYIGQSYRKLKPNRYVLFQFTFYPKATVHEHDKPNEQNSSNWDPDEFSAEMRNAGFSISGIQKTMVATTEVYYLVAQKQGE